MLRIPDALYDRVLLFFLLHEMPREVREATLREALRVVKPGGKLVVVDFARPVCLAPAEVPVAPGADPAGTLRARSLDAAGRDLAA